MLQVHYRQSTLGCYIVLCKREGAEKISELRDEELIELKKVFAEIEQALLNNKTFTPDWFNYWQMGNQLRHLHFHGFPRYEHTRMFDGKEWVDETFGHPPLWSKQDVSHELVKKIREEIKLYLF